MANSMRPGFMDSSGGRRGVSTVEIAPPDPGSLGGPAQTTLRSEVGGEFGNIAKGRVSLLALNTLILMLVVYYMWTRSVQGS